MRSGPGQRRRRGSRAGVGLGALVLVVLGLLAAAPRAGAEIYRWTDEDGRLHISNVPPRQRAAERVAEDRDRQALRTRADDQVSAAMDFYQRLYGAEADAPEDPEVDDPRAHTALPSIDPLVQDRSGDELVRGHEDVAAAQARLMAEVEDAITATDPGRADMHFVGFAGDAKQDVFMRELRYVEELVGRTYGDRLRSTVLVNHPSTTATHLIASEANLARVLALHGAAMDENDFLFLYLSSHGSAEHELEVDFQPYAHGHVTPDELAAMLDAARIRWRVVVVSACYAGGFVPALRSPFTIIGAAADAEHASFGCSNTRDFTYYGEAVFPRQMAEGVGLLGALDGARAIVRTMEAEQGVDAHSNAQLDVGPRMRARLLAFDRRR